MTYFLYNYRSTLTLISVKFPSSTIIISLYVSARRQAPDMSKHATALYSYAFMSVVIKDASLKNVGDIASYLLIYVCFLLPFSQALPFTLPSSFSLRNTKEAIALVSSSFVIFLESMGEKSFISWIR